ncbi:MAG: hypothetical protein ACNYNX_07945 [Leucobacter sp.]
MQHASHRYAAHRQVAHRDAAYRDTVCRNTAYRRIRALIAGLLVLLTGLALCAHLFGTTSSHAAGDGQMLSYGGWTVGTRQLASGEFVYCIEPGALTPAGAQLAPAEVDELRAYSFFTYDDTGWSGVTSSGPVSGESLRRINYVLSQYGEAPDAAHAVAVQFAIWLLRESPGEAAWLDHHIAWVQAHGGAAEIARARALADEARLAAVAPLRATPTPLQLSAGEELGTGTVSYPVGTVELRLEGAVFADGSETLTLDGTAAGVAHWTAQLHAEIWEGHREVGVTGRWDLSQAGWPARLLIYPAEITSEQTLAWAVGPVEEGHSGDFERSSIAIDTVFEPVLSTRVVQRLLIADDDPFADTVTLGVAADSSAWPARPGEGEAVEYLPLRIEGVVYGPFEEVQPVSAEAPDDAPVAGRAELLADRGPGSYEVTASRLPSESGYYYWVWTVSDAGQDSAIRAAGLLPEGYRFADDFGLPAEQHLVRAQTLELARTGSGAAPPALASGAGIGVVLLGAGALLLGGLRRHRMRHVQQACSRP